MTDKTRAKIKNKFEFLISNQINISLDILLSIAFEDKVVKINKFQNYKKALKELIIELDLPNELYEQVSKLSYDIIFEKFVVDRYFYKDLDDLLKNIDLIEKAMDNNAPKIFKRIKFVSILLWYGFQMEDIESLRIENMVGNKKIKVNNKIFYLSESKYYSFIKQILQENIIINSGIIARNVQVLNDYVDKLNETKFKYRYISQAEVYENGRLYAMYLLQIIQKHINLLEAAKQVSLGRIKVIRNSKQATALKKEYVIWHERFY